MTEDYDEIQRASHTGLLIAVLVISAILHGISLWALKDCTLAGVDVSQRAERNRHPNRAPMNVARMPGDPLAAERYAAGRPQAARDQEDDAGRVVRMTEPLQAEAASPARARLEEETRETQAARESAREIDTQAWQPRQEILEVKNPIVPDTEAALPRRITPSAPRIASAADVTAPAEPGLKPATVALPESISGVKGTEAAMTVTALPTEALANKMTLSGDFGKMADQAVFGLGEAALHQTPRVTTQENPATDKPPAATLPTAPAANVKLSETAGRKADVVQVERMKEAVRQLRDRPVKTENFAANVRTDLAYWVDPAHPTFKYFRVRISSDSDHPLPVIPKDVIYLLDASGSIGDERLRDCREKISRELRLLNSDDRFNIVAFRDRFSYAFDTWQSVDANSVQAADRWLKKLLAHGRTDVFATLESIMNVPRDPARPMTALVVTDGEATSGLTKSAEILARFAELNGGLVSVYMYGVKGKANAYLMDMLARGNRGGWGRFDGILKFNAAEGIPELAAKFADPVLSDVQVTFAQTTKAETYPRLVTNLCKAEPIEIWGICPTDRKDVVFSVKGLNGKTVFENVFKLAFDPKNTLDESARTEWAKRRIYAMIGAYVSAPNRRQLAEMKAFAREYGVTLPHAAEIAK